MRAKVLGVYLLRSFLPSFAMSLGAFLAVLLMNHFLRLFNMAVMKGLPIGWIFFCFSRLLPYFLSLALPMAFLVGLMLALGQLSESGEVLALRSSGYSFSEMMRPYLLISGLLSALLWYINHKASPEGFHSFKESYSVAASHIARLDVEPRTYLNLGQWQFYAEEADRNGGKLRGVRLVKKKGEYGRLRVSAPEGSVRVSPGSGIELELRSGTLIFPNADPEAATSGSFSRYRVLIPFSEGGPARVPDMQEINTRRLRERLRSEPLELRTRIAYLAEIAVRGAGALAPFVMFWVACPLGVRLDKRGRVAAFALSLGLIFAYYGLLATGISLGRKGLALAPWGPWLPDVVCGLAGAVLWRRQLSG